MNFNKYLPESRPKRFWKPLTNYNPLTFIQLFFNSKVKRMPRISSLYKGQRRQAALRRSRSQYAQNESQIRTRNAQHIALTRTSNLEVAEETRSRNSSARSQRRRSERIRARERLRNADNHATWRAIEKIEDSSAHGTLKRTQAPGRTPKSDDESSRETLLIMLPGDRSRKIEDSSVHGTLQRTQAPALIPKGDDESSRETLLISYL